MEIMDKSTKRKYAIVCFLPAVAFLISGIWSIAILSPLIAQQQMENHLGVMSLLNANNGAVIAMMLVTFLTHIVSLIYCVVHLARVKYMNSASKILWTVFLAAAAPVSYIVFYFMKIRHEPKYLETHAGIA